MGYTDLDRALIDAWHRAYNNYKGDPAALERVLKRFSGPTYTRPLRSWSLVLRADDKRIPDDSGQGVVRLDAARVRTWCSPVVIDYPGVSLDEAARRFGVNRTTVARWASPPAPEDGCTPKREPSGVKESGVKETWWQNVRRQIERTPIDSRFGRPSVYRVAGARLMLEHEVNRANPKRSTTRVWTPGFDGLDPGGAVWSGDWGGLRAGLASCVPDGYAQHLVRQDRRLGVVKAGGRSIGAGPASRVMQWVCPVSDGGCGERVAKLYLPMPHWTLLAAMGGVTQRVDRYGLAFRCRRCAGLIYESSERTSSPGRRKEGERRVLDPWDRLVRRISGGLLGQYAIRPAQ